jgi:hypothetical protein
VSAYWAAVHECGRDPKTARERLGLTRNGMEAAAKAHIDASKWLRHHLIKATGLHIADEVWESIDRHLFADARGKRHGRPRVGKWFDFTRIPGRAKSHTKNTATWETYRMVGSLDGHLHTYRDSGLDTSLWTGEQATQLGAGVSVLAQPRHLQAPAKPSPGSWWEHDGALAVIYSGLASGDIVLPVRLAQGSGQWAHLHHLLGESSVWHRIDLVRVQDRRATGGWRYYAHLIVLKAGYTSTSTQLQRDATPTDRTGGVDGNVSNLAVVSVPVSGSNDALGVLADHITVSAAATTLSDPRCA